MTTAAELLDALHASLATAYPTRRAGSARVGRVGCVVEPDGAVYEAAPCEPQPITLTARIRVQAAGADEQAVTDLVHHAGPVAALVRAAGFACLDWRADNDTDRPEIVVTATAQGTG